MAHTDVGIKIKLVSIKLCIVAGHVVHLEYVAGMYIAILILND